MKISINWKKTGIIFISLLCGLYIIFLILPFIISPVVNSYRSQAENLIKVSTGLDIHIENLGITTSPKLEAGLKLKEFTAYTPQDKTPILVLENAEVNLRLLPLFVKKVRLGSIRADVVEADIALDKSGMPLILNYMPEQNDENQQGIESLHFGFKLSNHLPDVKIKEYKLSLSDENKEKTYYADGKNLNITDFILDKKIKISTKGQIVFDKRIVSNYDIKITNKIMPNWQIDDMVFPKEVKLEDDSSVNNVQDYNLNIIDIFESINKNGFKADLNADIKTSGTFKHPMQSGLFELAGISVISDGIQLPESYAKLHFKGRQTDVDSIFYTSPDINEKTQLFGDIKSGPKPSVRITLRSNAKFNNIIRLIDSIYQSFGKTDLKTISASGEIDADFNISSDLKSINSTGYLKIPSGSINYGLYNILINNINTDIDLNNNNAYIKNISFDVMGNPLNITGKISSDAVSDIEINANNLSVKGLIGAIGQVGILNDNDFNSGTISLKAIIKGTLKDIKPDIKLIADNVDIYNKTSQARLTLHKAIVKFLLAKNKINGDIDINSLKIKHDAAFVSIPNALISMDSKDINIKNSVVMINNSKINVTGSVKDYLNQNLNMDINAEGNLASSDVIAFVPQELKWMISSAGSMPLSIKAKGNDKTQHLTFNLNATPNGYVRILDINKLRGKNTKIYTDVKIENNSALLENSGIYANSERIAEFNGGIKNLSNPNLNINISVPQDISFFIPGMGNNSNITLNGTVNLGGSPINPKLKGRVNARDISIKDMDFALTNLTANLNGEGISGDANAEKMKFGGITGTNISSKFSLNNFTVFNLNDIKSDVFGGKVTGKLTYHIPTFAFGVDLTGKELNSTDAVYGTVGIQKALTGIMGFGAKLTSKGVTDTEIIKNMKGNIDFNINDGRFISIGKLENLVAAQNIISNSILKSALSALTTAANITETNKFKTITGEITMSDGSANIGFIKVSGPLMSYYVKGIYNVLQNSANLVILGRLDSKVVSYLGPVGQLSAEKLLSYIPNFGSATAKYLKLMTQDPKNENIELIPALSSGSNTYKDFKVIYNGSIEKTSSVKSFKWLSTCDTTQMDLKQEVKNAVQATKDNVKTQADAAKKTAENVKSNVNKIVETQKQNIDSEKKTIEQTKKDIQNIKQNAGQSAANLSNLLKNAASNANKKMETPQTQQQPKTITEATQTKTESDTPTQSE